MRDAVTHQYRLGYYQVGTEKIINKSQALIRASATGHTVHWNFNDDIYSKFDWSIPVNVALPDLYKLRAQQLRDQYDHLMLYYSGGADSTNVLHAFIDNNIFIDEIVMQYPKPLESTMNNIDTGNDNYFSEIKYAAMVHLDQVKHRLDPRTRIRILDQAADTTTIFKKDNWFEQFPLGTMITPAATGRQISAIIDPELDKLYTQGKTVCQIYGVDKPIVSVNDEGEYFSYFIDAHATHAVPTGYNLGDLASKFFFMEFFYWTPDLPEIAIRQAQEIKLVAETDRNVHWHLKNAGSLHIDQLRSVLHPIIYCTEANAPVFQTRKPGSNVYRPMDKWFWLPEFKQSQENYLNIIDYLDQVIDPKYLSNNSVYNGLLPIHSQTYKL
jgi:hypothetical protein